MFKTLRRAGYNFVKGIYVELEQYFEISGFWEMATKTIKKLESKESAGKPLHVGAFRSKGRRLYP